jgi:hypothetical protein
MIASASPTSVIMTGTPQENGISFTADQAIGTEINGCSLSTLSIVEFGQGQKTQSRKQPAVPER